MRKSCMMKMGTGSYPSVATPTRGGSSCSGFPRSWVSSSSSSAAPSARRVTAEELQVTRRVKLSRGKQRALILTFTQRLYIDFHSTTLYRLSLDDSISTFTQRLYTDFHSTTHSAVLIVLAVFVGMVGPCHSISRIFCRSEDKDDDSSSSSSSDDGDDDDEGQLFKSREPGEYRRVWMRR